MSQSLVQILLHIVFSTKQRKTFLKDHSLREETLAYLSGTCKNLGSPSIIVGGVEDHVHILCHQSKNISVAELVRDLKRESSKWLKSKGPRLAGFYWQKGYGAFSISPSHVKGLTTYIRNQEKHHRRESFKDEFRRLCAKYDVEMDERYVWD